MTDPLIRIGERVRHRTLSSLDIGEVVEVLRGGKVRIKFPSGSKVVGLVDGFVFVDREATYAKQQLKKETLRSECLAAIEIAFENDFLSSEDRFGCDSANVLSRNEFERAKARFVQSWISDKFGADKDRKYEAPDDEQASAIAAVNGHIQVVARAGSGKTTTLVNRALFLLKHCGVAPSQMLLLAFNRKAVFEIRRRLLGLLGDGAEAAVVEEIARRRRQSAQKNRNALDDMEADAVSAVAAKLNVSLPYVMTFHALAHSVVHPDGTILFNGPDGTGQGLSKVFQQVIDDHLQIPEFNLRIRELMLAHFKEDWDRIVEGGYDKSKDELLRFRRSLPRESLGGDYVKSYGEKVIADFLFEHDVAYKYERNHWWNSKIDGKNVRTNYLPDFTIFKSEIKGSQSGVIIEYFGLKGDADYDEMLREKREYWKAKPNWELIDFSPFDINAQGGEVFLSNLKTQLENHGVRCARLSEDELWHRLSERAIDRFTKAVVGFMGRCRKQSWTQSELQTRIDNHISQSPVESMFLALTHRLYVAYLKRLTETGEDDFDGLMQRAAESIQSGQTLFQRKSGGGDLKELRFVCIDEYQDFSDLFHRLITAIRRQNSDIELFCVGDDWQAINGFAGSDLQFFENFEKYVGESHKLHLSTNYRSSSAIVAIGNLLMNGLGKPAIAHKATAGQVLVTDLSRFEPTLIERKIHPGDSITPAVLRLASKAIDDGHDVVMLCRRNGLPWFVNYGGQENGAGRGIDRYLSYVRSFFPKDIQGQITISTAHKYKGLERSVVIVLDAVARSYPLIHPDWVFSRIFGDSPAKINQEERRLLYVALTRAIDTLIIVTDGRSKSPFLEEIECQQTLGSLDWANYPPVRSLTDRRLIVQVKNATRRVWDGGTFAIKDRLQAKRYTWDCVRETWEKSFPEESFSLSVVQGEVWADSADGIDVTILDDTQTELAMYTVSFGVWTCRFDNFGMAKEKGIEIQTEVAK